VLFEDEVNPVMSAALDSGLQVTALHNHFFFDKPKVYFMHIGGEGSLEKLAQGVRGKLRVYDGKSLMVRDTIEFGADADNVRYDQETGDIWVGYGNGGIGIVNSTGKKRSHQLCSVPIPNPSDLRRTGIAFTGLVRSFR
jgi:hypothetical protein